MKTSQLTCVFALILLFSCLSFAQNNAPLNSPANSCDAVAGNLITNCGFETGDFTGWTKTPAACGSALSVSTFPNSGNYSANFHGACAGSYDAIQQTLTTTAGLQYNLSFWLESRVPAILGIGSGRDFQVLWNGVVIYDSSTPPVFPYSQIALTVTGTGSDVLKFQGYNLPNVDALDDVVLTGNSTSSANLYLLTDWWYWFTPGGGNAPPIANAQTAATNEDIPVTITLSGSDPEGANLTFSIVSGPTNGTLGPIVPINGTSATVQFTPGPNFNGAASFTYKVNDGTQYSAEAAVNISITPVNDAPSFTKGPDQNIVQNGPAQTIPNWATAISPGPPDEASQTVSFTVIGNTNPGLFLVAPAISPTGTLTYTPATGQAGSATITIRLSDNGGTANGGVDTSAPQTFNINISFVNQPPSFTKGPDKTVLEDAGPQSFPNWATAISPGPPSESGQVVSFNITGNTNAALFSAGPAVSSTGTLTFTPAANANGTATITLVAHDNGGTANGGNDTSAPQTFTINVTAVNDAPSFTKGPDQNIVQDAPAQSVPNWATAISPGPPNEAGQTVSFTVTGNTNPGLFSVAPAISPAGTLTYTPAPGQSGSSTITVTLSDNGGTANGGVDTSAPQTFAINIALVNHAPSFTKGPDKTVLEDAGPQSFPAWATAISPGPPSESGQIVSFNITGNTNPTLFSVGPAVSSTGTLTFTPAANANGTATITIVAKDNGGTANGGVDTSAPQTFTINVTAVNDVPSFTKGADETVFEDTGAHTTNGWATAISAGPPDESGQTLNFIVSNNNNSLFSVQPAISSNGNLTYTLAANAFGSATVTVQIHDNGGTANGGVDTSAAQTFVINVTGINDAPSFTKGPDQTTVEDAAPGSVSGWATAISAGPNEGTQTVNFIVSNNNNALFSVQPAISPTGVLTYTLAANANGTATVTVALHDDGGTANGGVDTSTPQTFTITVAAVNDPPSFTKGADETVLEDSGAHTTNLWATALSAGPPDESGQTLNFIVSNNNNSLFSVQPAISPAGNLTYTPAANAFGTATVTVQIHDNGGTSNGGVDTSAAQTFVINVTGINDAPSFTKGPDQTTVEDAAPASVSGWATAISAGPNEGTQTVNFIVSNNNNPLFSVQPAVSPSGALTFTLAPNANGTATVTVQIHDDGGTANGGVDTSASQTFTINVTPVNDPPSFTKGPDQTIVLSAGAQTVNPWATSISAGPANESGQTLNFLITGNTNPALFSAGPAVSATGVLTYTPAGTGTATITLAIHDNGGTANGGVDTSATQTFVITVNGPPQIISANTTTFAPGKTGQTFTVNTTGFPTGASMSITDAGGFPTGVSLTNNNNGTATIAGTPAAGTAGNSGSPRSQAYPVNITANNGIAPNATQAFTLNVTCPVINVSGTSPLNLVFNVDSATTIPSVANRTYTQSGGNGTINWTMAAGPAGLSINSSTGVVSGTPTVTGTFSATITATDAGACTSTQIVSIPVAPIAISDAYSGLVDNTQAVVTGGLTATPSTPFVGLSGTVISNDLPAGAITAIPGTFATTNGGSVIISTDGTFKFTPPARPNLPAITSDSFNYTIASNTGGAPAAATATGTVNLTLGGRVWYVSSTGSDSNTGQSQAPFLTLGQAASPTVSTSNDTIYLYSGNDANLGAASLKQGQSLIGQGVALVVNGKTLVTAGLFPTLGGTLTASGITGLTVNGLSASTTGVPAVNLTNSDGNFTFKSVSTSGGTNGIVWNNSSAATGSFTVNGDGSNVALGGNSSGGTISGMSGADGAIAGSGIYLNNAHNVTLRRMTINGPNQNYGIRGTNVTGFVMEYSTVQGTNGNNASFFEGSVIFDGLFGTAAGSTANSITSSIIKGGWGDNFRLANTNGTSELTISNSTISNTNTGSNGNDNVHIDCHLTANITVHITGSTFAATNGDHIQTIADGTSHLTIVATGNTLSGGGGASALGQGITISGGDVNSSVDSTEVVRFNISNNNMTGTIQGGAININEGVGNGDWQGQVSNNTIGNPAIAGSGASQSAGIRVENHAKGTLTAIVHLNAVHQWRDEGISLHAGDTSATGLTNGPLNVTLTNNTVDTPYTPAGTPGDHGIMLEAGTQIGNTNLVCADISGNDSLGVAVNGGVDYRLRQRMATTIRLPGYTGANNDNAAVRTYILGRPNTAHQASGSDVAASNSVPTGGGFINTSPAGSQCTQPIVPN